MRLKKRLDACIQLIMQRLKRKLLKYRWKLIKMARKHGIYLKIPLPVPSAFITGSIGKTTTCRMLAHILATGGYKVALSTSQGTYIDGRTIRTGDSSNCYYASRLILDKSVDAAVFELARGGLISQGVVFNHSTVAAVLNVHDNHVGLHGIESREQMAALKSQVAKSAQGLVALNADDSLCLHMRDSVSAQNVCLVSMTPDNPAVLQHCATGGHAVFLDGSPSPVIQVSHGEKILLRMPASRIPATLGGAFRPAVANAMFAIALAWGMGIDFKLISEALGSFVSDADNNPGRMNFFQGFPFRLLITYTDGPIAMAELAEFARREKIEGDRILMFCGSGDRSDEFLVDTGKAAAPAFDGFICSDYDNLRGRPSLQAACRLKEGLIAAGVSEQSISIAPSHDDALRMAFAKAKPGDLLVIESYYGLKSRELGLLAPGREV